MLYPAIPITLPIPYDRLQLFLGTLRNFTQIRTNFELFHLIFRNNMKQFGCWKLGSWTN
jgi:hypothetical protein